MIGAQHNMDTKNGAASSESSSMIKNRQRQLSTASTTTLKQVKFIILQMLLLFIYKNIFPAYVRAQFLLIYTHNWYARHWSGSQFPRWAKIYINMYKLTTPWRLVRNVIHHSIYRMLYNVRMHECEWILECTYDKSFLATFHQHTEERIISFRAAASSTDANLCSLQWKQAQNALQTA